MMSALNMRCGFTATTIVALIVLLLMLLLLGLQTASQCHLVPEQLDGQVHLANGRVHCVVLGWHRHVVHKDQLV